MCPRLALLYPGISNWRAFVNRAQGSLAQKVLAQKKKDEVAAMQAKIKGGKK